MMKLNKKIQNTISINNINIFMVWLLSFNIFIKYMIMCVVIGNF
jgi:hypothetical protein